MNRIRNVRQARVVVAVIGFLMTSLLSVGMAAAQTYTSTPGPGGGTGGSGSVKPSATETASSGGALAVTGGEAITLAIIGVVLLASGVAIVALSRRRAALTA